jgi:hypothetical protein
MRIKAGHWGISMSTYKDQRLVLDGKTHHRGMFRYTFHNDAGETIDDYVSEGDDTVELILS